MITYTKFIGKYCIKGTMIDDLDAVIAQAVQAERDACAKVADDIESRSAIRADHAKGDTKQQRIAQGDMAQSIAAAIRARNGAGRK